MLTHKDLPDSVEIRLADPLTYGHADRQADGFALRLAMETPM